MPIKQKSALVIIISSLVISAVLALTTFGFYAYLQWKEKNMQRNYKLALYEIDGRLFEKYITINLRAKIDTKGIFRGKPVVEGTIRNASSKTIYSLKLRIAFYSPKRRVVCVDTFYPIGLEPESLVSIGDIAKKTTNFLQEGNSISFKHKLKNCPPEVLDYLKSKLKFAKVEHGEPLELDYKIEGMDIR